jgi:lipoprotein-anchoring transpeptidase ErfK/SrfK
MLRISLLICCAFAGLTADAAAETARSRSDALFEPWRAPRSSRAGLGAFEGQSAVRQSRLPAVSGEGLAAARTQNLAPRLQRQVVEYPTAEPTGTIIVDTGNTYLYLVLGGGQAMRYGIGVGREGFEWSGRQRISRMAEWPDWRPPSEMLARDPDLPGFLPGGLQNPLGARALYLGDTLYRIHGTNEPSSIGTFRSSGCIRMLNADVIDLYQRVSLGAQVVVLASNARSEAPR